MCAACVYTVLFCGVTNSPSFWCQVLRAVRDLFVEAQLLAPEDLTVHLEHSSAMRYSS